MPIYSPYEMYNTRFNPVSDTGVLISRNNPYNSTNLAAVQREMARNNFKPILGELYFIYGTLKSGFRNHYLLKQERMQLVVSQASIRKYKIAEISRGLPGAVYGAGYIIGELWDMHKDNIDIMNILERNYVKVLVKVEIMSVDSVMCVPAYTWRWPGQPSTGQLYNRWTLDRDAI